MPLNNVGDIESQEYAETQLQEFSEWLLVARPSVAKNLQKTAPVAFKQAYSFPAKLKVK